MILSLIDCFNPIHRFRGLKNYRNSPLKMIKQNILDTLSNSISEKIKVQIKLQASDNFSSSGGSGATTIILTCSNTKMSYFIKLGSMQSFNMLRAEYLGVEEIFNTNTIRVPQPISYGVEDNISFVIFEKLNFGNQGSPTLFARKLAEMHKCTNENYGYSIDNSIGSTFQPNEWTDSWSEFWDKNRLGHMLSLAKRKGGVIFPNDDLLREKVKSILKLREKQIKPSLVHGDLWSGNYAYLKNGEPVLFDPAIYYGDFEVDLAMTKLFGTNSKPFYDEYSTISEYPTDGYEIREDIYNLYHILNHYVLFGGGYLSQAYDMINKIIRY